MRNNQERMQNTGFESVNSAFNYISPTYLVDLPSKGVFYPGGHPLNGKTTVELREMTAKEEDILFNKSFLERGIVLEKLLQSLFVDKSIDPASLLVIDKNALLLAARINGYGPEYPIKANCPACLSQFDSVVDLNTLLKIREPVQKDGVILLSNGLLSVTLPVTKWVVVIKPLSGADQDNLQKILETKKKNNIDQNSLIENIRSYVVSINGVIDGTSIYEAITNMPARDSKLLRNVYSDCFPNITTTSQVVCTVCRETADLEVPFTISFFWSK